MTDNRKARRVSFASGVPTFMMAIDGTWRRSCLLKDVSDTGAKVKVEGSVQGLQLNEFFLLLSSTGLAYRRCQLVWVNGEELGMTFLKPGMKSGMTKRQMSAAAPPPS